MGHTRHTHTVSMGRINWGHGHFVMSWSKYSGDAMKPGNNANTEGEQNQTSRCMSETKLGFASMYVYRRRVVLRLTFRINIRIDLAL